MMINQQITKEKRTRLHKACNKIAKTGNNFSINSQFFTKDLVEFQ